MRAVDLVEELARAIASPSSSSAAAAAVALQSEPRALAAAMQQAQQNELEAMTDMFNKMTEQCFRKCVALYKEEHLSVGEATCVDRCVHKYMAAHGKVQDILGKQAQQMQGMVKPG